MNMFETAKELPLGWVSRVLADMPASRVKLFRIDPAGLPSETHLGYNEAMIVLEGKLELRLGEDVLPLSRGDFALIPARVPHEILPGGTGTILLLDPE